MSRNSDRQLSSRSGQLGDHVDDVLSPISVAPGELDQVTRPAQHGAPFGCSSYRDASPSAKLEQPLVSKDSEGAPHGICIDVKDGCEVSSGWQPLASSCLTLSDCASDLRRDLVVQSEVFVTVYLDSEHGAINSSTMAAPTETVILEAELHQKRPDGPVLLIPEARGRQRHRHRRVAVMVIVLALGLVAVVAAGTVLFRGGAPSAGEGGPATPTELKADSSACQSSWRTLRLQSPLSGRAPALLPAVTVSEVRGTYAALLYIKGPGSWTCFLSSPSSVVGLGGSTDGSFSRTPSASDPVTLSSPALFTNVKAKFQLVEGQAARDVSSITLTLSSGTKVRPTLRGGYFVAFWAGTASVVSSSYRIGNAAFQSGAAQPSPTQVFDGRLP